MKGKRHNIFRFVDYKTFSFIFILNIADVSCLLHPFLPMDGIKLPIINLIEKCALINECCAVCRRCRGECFKKKLNKYLQEIE